MDKRRGEKGVRNRTSHSRELFDRIKYGKWTHFNTALHAARDFTMGHPEIEESQLLYSMHTNEVNVGGTG